MTTNPPNLPDPADPILKNVRYNSNLAMVLSAAAILISWIVVQTLIKQPPAYLDDVDESVAFEVPEVEASSIAGRFRPNPKLTPGAVWKSVTMKDIKESGYTKRVRDVPMSRKIKVMARYGLDPKDLSKYEIDHYVALCLGGSNAIENLWPQPYDEVWNARVKDRLESYCLRKVRSGEMPLDYAQKHMAKDWIAFYKSELGETPQQAMTRAEEQ